MFEYCRWKIGTNYIIKQQNSSLTITIKTVQGETSCTARGIVVKLNSKDLLRVFLLRVI